MYKVYAIKSQLDSRIYFGFTTNLERRLKEHNSGKTRSTKAFVPWSIIYTEEQPDRISARSREKYLKSGMGKEFLESL